ncbi:MAG: DMT family transporter, partial [Caldimonas sp.]
MGDEAATKGKTEGGRGEARGLTLGLLGVVIFALTVPMTRLAVGPALDPQLPPLFVTAGRAACAGLLAVLYLAATRAGRPRLRHLRGLVVCALGTVVGFPLFLGLALRHVDAIHAAVVTGVLPLATALVAAASFRQRPSLGFWVCAVLGAGLVIAFAAWKGGGHLSGADALLLLAVASAAIGYVAGARLSAEIAAERVICWVLVVSLPLTVPAMLLTWPQQT